MPSKGKKLGSNGRVHQPKPQTHQTAADIEREVKEQELRIKCFDLRKVGASYTDIAKAVGLPHATAAVDYVRARIRDLDVYEKETLREIWLADYHGLLSVKLQLQRQISGGGRDLARNVMALVQVLKRISGMLGYDEPIQVRNVHEGNVNVHATASIAIDYSRLTADELRVMERIFEQCRVGTGQAQSGNGTPELPGVREAGVADPEPVN